MVKVPYCISLLGNLKKLSSVVLEFVFLHVLIKQLDLYNVDSILLQQIKIIIIIIINLIFKYLNILNKQTETT